MTAPKGRLFQLALECKKHVADKRSNKTVKITGKHYDEGRAISLSYNFDAYGQSIYDSYNHNEPSAQLSFVDDMQSEPFYVEPFDSETIPANYEEVSDDDPMLDRVVRGSETEQESEVYEESKAQAKADEEEETTNVVAEEEGEEYMPQKMESRKSDEGDTAYEGKTEDKPGHYEVADDEFADDIKAILQGQKVFDPDKKKTVSKSDSPSKELLKQGGYNRPPTQHMPKGEEEGLEPLANEHKIFEKIAQSMRYANSYDLGSIAMEKKFDQMENELEEEEIKTITTKKPEPVQDAEVISEEPKQTKQQVDAEPSESGKYDPKVPLNPKNGGVEIGEKSLQGGDIILITTSETGSEKTCQAGVYDGKEKVVMAGGDKKLTKTELNQVLNEGSVVLRHKDANTQSVQALTDKFIDESQISGVQDSILEISYAPIQIHKSVCQNLPEKDQGKCQNFKGRIDLGTPDNDKFYIPYKLIKALESSGLNILDKGIEGASADTPIKTNHNGQWQYAGHLKLKN